MLVSSSIPLILLMISGITATPTTLHPNQISTTTTTDPVIQILGTRMDTCEDKAEKATTNYEARVEWCDALGVVSFLAKKCYYLGKPWDCCPEYQMSEKCRKFWPQ